MYLPRVRMTPLGPAPYWKTVTVPVCCVSQAGSHHCRGPLTNDKAHDSTDSWRIVSRYSNGLCGHHILDPIRAPIFTKCLVSSAGHHRRGGDILLSKVEGPAGPPAAGPATTGMLSEAKGWQTEEQHS